jgi:hypothetical protein
MNKLKDIDWLFGAATSTAKSSYYVCVGACVTNSVFVDRNKFVTIACIKVSIGVFEVVGLYFTSG